MCLLFKMTKRICILFVSVSVSMTCLLWSPDLIYFSKQSIKVNTTANILDNFLFKIFYGLSPYLSLSNLTRAIFVQVPPSPLYSSKFSLNQSLFKQLNLIFLHLNSAYIFISILYFLLFSSYFTKYIEGTELVIWKLMNYGFKLYKINRDIAVTVIHFYSSCSF